MGGKTSTGENVRVVEYWYYDKSTDANGNRRRTTFVDPRMMQFLVDTAGKTRFEVAGPWTMCAVDRLEPERVPEVVTYNEGFQAQIPAVVSDLYP